VAVAIEGHVMQCTLSIFVISVWALSWDRPRLTRCLSKDTDRFCNSVRGSDAVSTICDVILQKNLVQVKSLLSDPR